MAPRKTLEKMQENGANFYVGGSWFVAAGALASTVVALVYPLFMGFNVFSIHAATPLIISCVFFAFTLLPTLLALGSSTVQNVIKSMFNGSDDEDTDRAPNVSQGIIAAALAFTVSMGAFWLVAGVLSSIWVHWWRTTAGTTHLMTDMTYGGLNTVDNPRAGVALIVTVAIMTITAMIQFAGASVILAFHMADVTPLKFAKKFQSGWGTRP